MAITINRHPFRTIPEQLPSHISTASQLRRHIASTYPRYEILIFDVASDGDEVFIVVANSHEHIRLLACFI